MTTEKPLSQDTFLALCDKHADDPVTLAGIKAEHKARGGFVGKSIDDMTGAFRDIFGKEPR